MNTHALPELSNVHWRQRVSECSLRRLGRLWTLTTIVHTVPFIGFGALLVALKPLLLPVGAIALAFAWVIPELYAARGANVVRSREVPDSRPERVALGLLGDLLDHAPRALLGRTGLALEQGELGTWLVGEAGALMVRPGGRRVWCYCVKPSGGALPRFDRVAHLLLALRTDEEGFATVANVAFSGATWRVRRRLPRDVRPALDAAASTRPR